MPPTKTATEGGEQAAANTNNANVAAENGAAEWTIANATTTTKRKMEWVRLEEGQT